MNKPDSIAEFIIIILFIAGFSACNRSNDVMSSSDFRKFLVDLHLLDGAYEIKKGNADEREKVYYYNALFQKHGITQAQFDSSLVYYTANPKTFDRIYAGVIRDLKEIQDDVKNHVYHPLLPDSTLLKPIIYNLWTNKTNYRFTPDSSRQKLYFVIKSSDLLTQDMYELFLYQSISKKDSSVNPHVVLRIHYADGKVDSAYAATMNDSLQRRIKLRLRAKQNVKIDSLSGFLLGSSKFLGKFNARVDSIRLMREYFPAIQDSLKQQLDTSYLRKKIVRPVKKV
jgi:hypothetical protein